MIATHTGIELAWVLLAAFAFTKVVALPALAQVRQRRRRKIFTLCGACTAVIILTGIIVFASLPIFAGYPANRAVAEPVSRPFECNALGISRATGIPQTWVHGLADVLVCANSVKF
jgi:hypothetical protein